MTNKVFVFLLLCYTLICVMIPQSNVHASDLVSVSNNDITVSANDILTVSDNDISTDILTVSDNDIPTEEEAIPEEEEDIPEEEEVIPEEEEVIQEEEEEEEEVIMESQVVELENYNSTEPAYTITLPKKVVLSGEDGTGSYIITVKGVIDTDEHISITPTESFKLVNQLGNEVDVSVKQEKKVFASDEISTGIDVSGSITAKDLSRGSWYGKFSFDISINNGVPEIENTSMLTNYVTLPSLEDCKILKVEEQSFNNTHSGLCEYLTLQGGC